MKRARTKRRRTAVGTTGLLIALAMVGSAISQAAFAQNPKYRFAMIDLGDLGGYSANIFALDSKGNAVGCAWLPENVTAHAVKFQLDGDPIDLGTLEGNESVALGVNEKGDVAGWSRGADGYPKPVLWRDNQLIYLGTLGGDAGFAYDVNGSTVVVGSSHTPDLVRVPFRWENGVMTQLPTHEGFSEARDINEAGQIVGYTIADDYPRRRAVLWENGELIDLAPLFGGSQSEAWAINELAQIVGWSRNDGPDGEKNCAVVWDHGEALRIQPVAKSIASSYAYSINNRTQVVGTMNFKYREPTAHGFIWQESTGMRSLMEIVPPQSGLQIDAAFGINDNTEIAARAWRLKDGWYRALLLVPVDPELTLSDPVPGVAGEVNTWTVTGAQPGSKIIFTYSVKGGGTVVPGCDKLDAVLQINNPKIMKGAIADADGKATIQMYVPPAAKNAGDILFQAVSVKDCEESQLVVFAFE